MWRGPWPLILRLLISVGCSYLWATSDLWLYVGGNFKVSVRFWGLACPRTIWINRLFILRNQSSSVASLNCLCSCRTETKPTRNKSKELKFEYANQSAIAIHAAPSSLQRRISRVFGTLPDRVGGCRELASNRNEKILHFSMVISLYTAPAPFSPQAPSSHLQSTLAARLLFPHRIASQEFACITVVQMG